MAVERWRGLKALVHDTIDATTALVKEGSDSTHRNVRRLTDKVEPIALPARMVDGVVRLSTNGTLGTIQVVNRVVESLTDLALDAAIPIESMEPPPPIPLNSQLFGTPTWLADAAVATVNAAIGHHLAATHNPLDLGLRLRLGDRYLEPGEVTDLEGTVLVLVHGLGATEWGWVQNADDYYGDPEADIGSQLARDAGVGVLYVRYNTGRRIPVNGLALSHALQNALPNAGLIVLVGHSMGGLVARSACNQAQKQGHDWLSRLALVVSLGSPHKGAPLARLGATAEKGFDAVDLASTQVLARLLAARSAGIRDLEHGDVSDLAQDPDRARSPEDRVVPLLEGVRYAFFSATVTEDPDHLVSRWLGDLMVQQGSATSPSRHDTFPIDTGNFPGVLHHQLQSHPDVYAVLLRLIRPLTA